MFLDKLFDSCNSHCKIAPSSKPLKGALTASSGHEEFWSYAIQQLNSIEYYCYKRKRMVKIPSIKNLIFTLKGFIYVKNKILINNPEYYICLREVNQDCLENFFSSIRSHGVRNINPSTSHFSKSFKSLLVNNFMSSHSPSSNCEQDQHEGALDNLHCLLTGDVLPGVTPLEEVEATSLVPHNFLIRKSKISRCTVKYVAGYLARVLKKKNKCSFCLMHILEDKSKLQIDADFIDARQYENSQLTTPGTLFYLTVGRSLNYLFYTIPRLSNKKKITEILVAFLKKQVNFKPFKCTLHSNLGDSILNLIVKCSIYFWCRQVNQIANGRDTKYSMYVKKQKNKSLLDPIKLMAIKKYENNKKRFKKDCV